MERPIIAYLKDGVLPDDKVEAQKLQHLDIRYIPLGDLLYKKSYPNLLSDLYLRCLGPDEAKIVMQEIHDGNCGNHVGGRSLPTKHNQGYYWTKMFNDTEYVKKCPQCQRFALSSSRPSADLHTFWGLWPFMQLELDVVGPLPLA